jgi:hypothetical protein
MEVIKYGKMKPSEVALLELLSIHAVHRRLWQDELSSCRSLRKMEWRHPRSCAVCSSLFLLPRFIADV